MANIGLITSRHGPQIVTIRQWMHQDPQGVAEREPGGSQGINYHVLGGVWGPTVETRTQQNKTQVVAMLGLGMLDMASARSKHLMRCCDYSTYF